MRGGARCCLPKTARAWWPRPARSAIRASTVATWCGVSITAFRPSCYDWKGAPMSGPTEQREAARIAATFKVKYESFDQFLTEYTQDLSRGGMFLVTRSFLPKNSVIRCVLF